MFDPFLMIMIIHSYTKNQVKISNHSEIKWWQLNSWPNFKAQRLQVDQKSFNRNEFQSWSAVNDFGIWNLQAIRASTYENFTDPNTYSLAQK